MGKCVKSKFDIETGKSEVIIWDKGKRYRGTAIAHEEDTDIKNQYTGLTIANARAEIERAESKAKEIGRKMSKLGEQMANLSERQSIYVKTAISLRADLASYMEEKAKFATKLRAMREKKK